MDKYTSELRADELCQTQLDDYGQLFKNTWLNPFSLTHNYYKTV
jgi:hypothetical protein